jgi:hypothetical protein
MRWSRSLVQPSWSICRALRSWIAAASTLWWRPRTEFWPTDWVSWWSLDRVRLFVGLWRSWGLVGGSWRGRQTGIGRHSEPFRPDSEPLASRTPATPSVRPGGPDRPNPDPPSPRGEKHLPVHEGASWQCVAWSCRLRINRQHLPGSAMNPGQGSPGWGIGLMGRP